MTEQIVIDVQSTATVIGWLTQMWPMITGTAGAIGGVIMWVARSHRRIHADLADCERTRTEQAEDIRELKGGQQTLLRLVEAHMIKCPGHP